MGYELKNASGKIFHISSSVWPEVLNLAIFFGWKPMGKYIKDRLDISDEENIRKTQESMDGNYTDNDGQLVGENDALNLAFSLMKAVKVLPDENLNDLLHPVRNLEHRAEGIIAMFHWDGEKGKNLLIDFIRFCIGGEFDIR